LAELAVLWQLPLVLVVLELAVVSKSQVVEVLQAQRARPVLPQVMQVRVPVVRLLCRLALQLGLLVML
jgi:hypothetical protein